MIILQKIQRNFDFIEIKRTFWYSEVESNRLKCQKYIILKRNSIKLNETKNKWLCSIQITIVRTHNFYRIDGSSEKFEYTIINKYRSFLPYRNWVKLYRVMACIHYYTLAYIKMHITHTYFNILQFHFMTPRIHQNIFFFFFLQKWVAIKKMRWYPAKWYYWFRRTHTDIHSLFSRTLFALHLCQRNF